MISWFYRFDEVSIERLLLVAAGVFVGLCWALLLVVRSSVLSDAWPFLIWCLACLAGHISLNQTVPRRSGVVFPVVMLLSGWGSVLVTRLAPAFAVRQVIWVIVAVFAGVAVTVIPGGMRLLRRYRYTWLIAGLALLAVTLVFGTNPSGNLFAPRLWLGLGGVFFQPSELLKLLLIVFLASYLSERRPALVSESGLVAGPIALPSLRFAGPMLLMWGFCMVLLVWQRDLGAAALFFFVFLVMVYVATGQLRYVVIGLLLSLMGALIGFLMFDVVRVRISTWIDPWSQADAAGFQIVQSLMAVSAGGIAGRGFGLGNPTFIPVVHSDFVYAAIFEEFGMVGTGVIAICLGVLVSEALAVSVHEELGGFQRLLAAGIAAIIAVQSMLIIGGTLKLLPLTGVTLPFVSYGGSSLLVSWIMVGLLLRLSDECNSRLSGGASGRANSDT